MKFHGELIKERKRIAEAVGLGKIANSLAEFYVKQGLSIYGDAYVSDVKITLREGRPTNEILDVIIQALRRDLLL